MGRPLSPSGFWSQQAQIPPHWAVFGQIRRFLGKAALRTQALFLSGQAPIVSRGAPTWRRYSRYRPREIFPLADQDRGK
jgi:hypothetical protein